MVNRKTYISAKAKLPANLRDGFVRITVNARAEEGDCLGQDGWLIKVVDSAPVTAAEQNASEASEKPLEPVK